MKKKSQKDQALLSNQNKQDLKTLSIVAVLFKIFITIAQMLVESSFKITDASFEFMDINFYGLTSIVSWDAYHFLSAATKGYQNLKSHAFFPGIPKFLNLMQYLAGEKFILAYYISNNVIFVFNALLLYVLTMKIINNRKMAYVSSIIFIFNPSSVFFNSIYSENLFTFQTLLAMIFYSYATHKHGVSCYTKLLIASIIMGFSVMTRSNGLTGVIIIGYKILQDFINNRKNIKRTIFNIVYGIFTGIVIVLPFFYYQVIVQSKFCQNKENYPFCTTLIPTVYNYIQNKYWGCHFFHFLWSTAFDQTFLGLQTLILLVYLTQKYMKTNGQSMITFGLIESKNSLSNKLNPFMLHLLFLEIAFLQAYIMSTTRFYACYPQFYWILANQLVKKFDSKISYVIVLYLIEFNIMGIVRFTLNDVWL